MKKNSVASVRSRLGAFPSPCTPNDCRGSGKPVYHKGSGSERVPLPLPSNSSWRHGNGSALLSFRNGRAMPSKWEDAEKWIFNPISGEGGFGSPPGLLPRHRRRKSKSGPLGTPIGTGSSCSSASPIVSGNDEGTIRNFAENSPFRTGILVTECGYSDNARSGRGRSGNEVRRGATEGGRRSYSAHVDQGTMQSASVHAWPDMLAESSSSLPSSQDEKCESTENAVTMISPVIQRKDVATQMSPEGSTSSSLKERHQFSPSSQSSSPTIEELQRHFSNLEVRDVQVDDLVPMSSWSTLHASCDTDKDLANIVEGKKKIVQPRASAWEVVDTPKGISKFEREEAKITAWENLQKAKAEAALMKLEVKLEKKRSASMDKILSKLRLAQRKAQDMRNEVTVCQVDQGARTAKKAPFFRMARQLGSLSGCFTCHVF